MKYTCDLCTNRNGQNQVTRKWSDLSFQLGLNRIKINRQNISVGIWFIPTDAK